MDASFYKTNNLSQKEFGAQTVSDHAREYYKNLHDRPNFNMSSIDPPRPTIKLYRVRQKTSVQHYLDDYRFSNCIMAGNVKIYFVHIIIIRLLSMNLYRVIIIL